MDERLINIDTESSNQSIYRVMPVVRLFEILESGCLTLVEPRAWDDPFENILLGGHMPEVLERDIGAKVFGISAFGQCWTTNQETDAAIFKSPVASTTQFFLNLHTAYRD